MDREERSLARHSMHLMVWLKDIYLGEDIEVGVPFTHPTLNYGFFALLCWGLKYLPLGHQVHHFLQLLLIFFLRLVLVPSSNTLKGCTLS